MQEERVNIFGAKISAISLNEAIALIEERIAEKRSGYVCICPVSSIIAVTEDEAFRQIINNSLISTPDGMPIVWYIKAKGFKNATRVCGSDLMREIFKVSEKRGYKHFFYGGTDDILLKIKENISKEFPRLKICGMYAPPFRELSEEENEKVVADINESSPDFVWIGISAPKQEKWAVRNVDKINSAILMPVGAVFNFYSGNVKRAPQWMQRCGFEWFFRLLCEPKRLWKRYLYGNAKFIYLLLKELFMHNFIKKTEKDRSG
jgi:N-acetylglucosaminyldiphosphoundecaprenol N-acetyl-beta-D-mannosaminyltransferase